LKEEREHKIQKAKEEEKVNLDKVFAEVDKIKDEAKVLFDQGQYQQAASVYEKAINKIEKVKPLFVHFIKDLCTKEASVLSNIAASFSKNEQKKKKFRLVLSF